VYEEKIIAAHHTTQKEADTEEGVNKGILGGTRFDDRCGRL
jgi:hypothetical protein